MTSALGLKARVEFSLHAFFACVILTFTYGMAAEPFRSTYLQTCIGNSLSVHLLVRFMHITFKCKNVHTHFQNFTEKINVTLFLANLPVIPLLPASDVEWKLSGHLLLFSTSNLLECQEVHYTFNKQVCRRYELCIKFDFLSGEGGGSY